MKKLVLVTLLAVAASWLLTEVRLPGLMTPAPSVVETREVEKPRHLTPPPPPPPPPPLTPPPPSLAKRLIPWRKGEPPRPKRVSVAVEDVNGLKNGPARPKGSAAPAANVVPAWFPKTEADEDAAARPDVSGSRVLVGRLSSSEKKAREDLRDILEREVTQWVAADVPTSWKVPSPLIDAMVQGNYVKSVTWSLKPTIGEAVVDSASTSASPTPDLTGLDDLQTLYKAGQKVEFSSKNRTRIVQAYRHDLATQRMQRLGGGLALTLACLAVLSGYIKADEATKGYYTNRLRLLAAAGLGVAGVVGYRMLV